MALPKDDDRIVPADEEPVLPDVAPPAPPADLEAPEADAVDQQSEVTPGPRVGPLSQDLEVSELDALEQAIEVPLLDDIDEE